MRYSHGLTGGGRAEGRSRGRGLGHHSFPCRVLSPCDVSRGNYQDYHVIVVHIFFLNATPLNHCVNSCPMCACQGVGVGGDEGVIGKGRQ